MRIEEVLELPSMPLAGPSYPKGPYRFIDREYMIISYETDPEIVREQLPEPLQPLDTPLVHYEFIKMPDSSGFGSYTESGLVIPCRYRGEEMNFVAQMYLDDDPPIVAGREIWGFPKKYAHPKLEIVKDTLTGTLEYSGQLVAMGTMAYKHESMAGNGVKTTATVRAPGRATSRILRGCVTHSPICSTRLPEGLNDDPDIRLLREAADRKVYNLVQLIYRSRDYEGHSKDYEFSRVGMQEHWRTGYHDALRTLRHRGVLERPSNQRGLSTFDLAQDGRE